MGSIFIGSMNGAKKNQKFITAIIISVTAIVFVIIGATIFINARKIATSDSASNTVSSKQAADSFKQQALKAEENKNDEQAIDLYKKAKAEYQEVGDTNSVVDMSAKIYILEHEE